jgi:hypothetical protein
MWANYICNFHKTAQSKQSSIGRKFAQYGHPASTAERKREEKINEKAKDP